MSAVPLPEVIAALRGPIGALGNARRKELADRIEKHGIAPEPKGEEAIEPPAGKYISKRQLKHALNCLSIDNALNTPDFELAENIWQRAIQYAAAPEEMEVRND